MIITNTITHYVIVPEIDIPTDKSDKFKNSDKYWHEINLGYNTPAFNIVFDAVSEAGKELFASISAE